MSVKSKSVIPALRKGRGGVKVRHCKNTENCEIIRITPPSRVLLSMQQHIGAPCIPTVKVGDEVKIGQKIGDSDKFISAPIHASISGKVSAIGDIQLPNGVIAKGVTIDSDGEMRLSDDIKPPTINNLDDLLNAVRESGLVGLGGAGFPSYVKLGVAKKQKIDTLVVNAAECEPFITVDYRECLDNSWDVLNGIYTLKEMLDIDNVVIAIENNKPEAIPVLEKIAASELNKNGQVKIMVLDSVYPQGAEKVMVYATTGRKVPAGKLPADVGCIVMNIASIAFISRYIKSGKPLVSRSLTIDGSAIKNPQNVRIPIGTNIQEIIDFCGGFKEPPAKIIMGGPMMGLTIMDTDLPTLKQTNAILAFGAKDSAVKKQGNCIRCARCAGVCPMNLVPTSIENAAKTKNIDALKKSGVNICMECGCCSFACPSGKPLVQHMRLAKSLVREASQ